MSKIIFFLKQIWQNKTIYRLFLNWRVRQDCSLLSGAVVDLAGGGEASYYEFLPANLKVVKTNYFSGKGIDQVVDLNASLPFADNQFDGVIFFNAIYILENINFTMKEIWRVLKPGGVCFLSSPFIANEMPEPHDYCRLTFEGLNKEFANVGFGEIIIKRMGERFSSSVYLISPFLFFRLIKAIIYLLAILFDKMIPKNIIKNHPAPLGYFCVLKK